MRSAIIYIYFILIVLRFVELNFISVTNPYNFVSYRKVL